MLTPKKNGPGGDFFSELSHRHHGEPAKAWGRKPLSQILRQARESRKLSLQEVARLTRIPVKYLHLLEGAGDKQLLAEPLSRISSLRRYSAFLNLNPDIAVTQFIAELEKLPPVEEEAGGGARPTQVLKPLPQPRSRVLPTAVFIRMRPLLILFSKCKPCLIRAATVRERLRGRLLTRTAQYLGTHASANRSRTILLLLALGLLALVGYYSELTREQRPNEDKVTPFSSPSATPPAPQSRTPPPASSPARSASPTDTGQLQPFPVPPAVSPPEAAAPQAEPPVASAARVEPPAGHASPRPQKSPGSAPHHLRVQAKAKTWLHVTIDGQPMKRLFLHPGQSVAWSAEKGFTLSLGNAGGVQLTLDEQELPPLGKAGQMVHNVRLPSQGGSQERQVRSTEHPLASKPRPPRR
jgi:cytoskeletal protein RodZ